jgi:hypothetical protein
MPDTTPVVTTDLTKYCIGALVAISITGVAGMIAMTYFSPDGSTSRIEMMFAFLTPSALAMIAVLKGHENGAKLEKLGVEMNGNINKLMDKTAEAATLTERAAGAKTALDLIAHTDPLLKSPEPPQSV